MTMAYSIVYLSWVHNKLAGAQLNDGKVGKEH